VLFGRSVAPVDREKEEGPDSIEQMDSSEGVSSKKRSWGDSLVGYLKKYILSCWNSYNPPHSKGTEDSTASGVLTSSLPGERIDNVTSSRSRNSSISSSEDENFYDVDYRCSTHSNQEYHTPSSSPRGSIDSLPDKVTGLREERVENGEVAVSPTSVNSFEQPSVEKATEEVLEQQSLKGIFTNEQFIYLKNILDQPPCSQPYSIKILKEVFEGNYFVARKDVAISFVKEKDHLKIKVSLSLEGETKSFFLKFFKNLFFSSLSSSELFSNLTDDQKGGLSQEYSSSTYAKEVDSITHVNFTISLNKQQHEKSQLSVELPGLVKRALDQLGISLTLQTVFNPPWPLSSVVNIQAANQATKDELDFQASDPNSDSFPGGLDLATNFQELAAIINDDSLKFQVDFTTGSPQNKS
jgi:hypothetical protein